MLNHCILFKMYNSLEKSQESNSDFSLEFQ